jgi:hypothetical protein
VYSSSNAVTKHRMQIEGVLNKEIVYYRGADKSLARPGRKQARKHVRDANDFNNIEARAVIKFFKFVGPCIILIVE